MLTSSGKPGLATREVEQPHPIAFSIHLSRNLVVQGLGLTMVCLIGLSLLDWPLVLGWATAAAFAIMAENQVLKRLAKGGAPASFARVWAPCLRFLATSIYALAALVLIAKGGPGERLFAFALMSASMVHVLMRYYRSPRVLVISLSPYFIILGLVDIGLTRSAVQDGRYLAALAPVFTIAMFAVQFWSARAQLSGAWVELMGARETAEERERAATAANRAKSEFLANMSHELRTPLNGVLGMAQALTSDSLTPTQRERVKIIRRSSETLLSVLNDLLDLSKIETNAFELDNVEFDLEHLVRGVAAAYYPLAQKKGVSFDLDVAVGANGHYLGDSGRLRRILHSLCDNAVKFTQAGRVLFAVDRIEERVVFRVTDTGIGIAPGDLSQLFDGFFQADGALTRRYGGAGIGLAVSRNLAILMGGEIQATSEPDQGSIFTLSVPLERLTASASEPSRPLAEASALKVLAAEDNATNQLVLKTLLGAIGIEAVLVNDGREAVAAWEAEDWDVVLMDIQMPEMDGLTATATIRARERQSGRARTPIIAVTANAMTHQIVEYETAGMDGTVAKPIDMAALVRVLEQTLTTPGSADAPEAKAVGG
ncbi:ATP-binding protein [Caulobacter sp. KR2-114]|uniref:ATP-binding protein n=1 Tax=Caulobacter sp. KR2-114 TaxID=3400912 RepID=UPI003C009854